MNFKKYKNNLGWCNYPFQNDPLGYCWSYAHFVDGTLSCKGYGEIKSEEKLREFCKDCDCFNPNRKLWRR